MTMVTKTMPASEFKAKCLALMDEVARTGEPVVITKNGKPVAELGPVEESRARKPIFGSHKGRLYPIGEVDLDEPVVDPSVWTADEENL
ncbi:MAG: type II toxin-antitoxin system Phd/YefM family antitoxin [Hyphomonadaceae bacterium]|nr:type II toxin-antitoxin system Phd/YefM family antitoxin [Hyphomonadaceae bacterium]